MAAATQPLPEASVTELSPGAAFAATGLPEIAVFVGPASKGPLNTPTSIGAQDTASLVAAFGTGPAVKECARALSLVAAGCVFVRTATAAVAAATHNFLITSATLVGFGVLSGTPTDGADIVVLCTISGTTGTSFSYELSMDGGATFAAPVAQGVALTIVVLGVTLTLTTGKVITAGDTVTWWQMPASSTILPVTIVRSGVPGTSTSAITASGTPNDAYEVLLQFQGPAEATVGTALAGFQYRYALDGLAPSPTFAPWTNLGAANSIVLLDGPNSAEPTGITINLGAGTLDPGDYASFQTTSPAYDSAGITAALAALKKWNGIWTWVRCVGPIAEALAATVNAIVLAWDAANLPSWGLGDTRDRGTYESVAAWAGRVRDEFTPYTSVRFPVFAGQARMSDPINGRNNRRPGMGAVMPRAMALPIAQNWAEFALGPLPPDVSIANASNVTVEFDSNTDNDLNAQGINTLRLWPGVQGVYPTNACLPPGVDDIAFIPLRRVMNVAKRVQLSAQRLQVLKTFRVIPQGAKAQTIAGYPPLMPGDLFGADIVKINRIVGGLVASAIVATGFATAITYQVAQTPVSLGGDAYRLTGKLQINGLIYVVEFDGTAQFVS